VPELFYHYRTNLESTCAGLQDKTKNGSSIFDIIEVYRRIYQFLVASGNYEQYQSVYQELRFFCVLYWYSCCHDSMRGTYLNKIWESLTEEDKELYHQHRFPAYVQRFLQQHFGELLDNATTGCSSERDTIHVVFSANVAYYQHLCVMLTSILENNPHRPFAFYVLTDQHAPDAVTSFAALKNRYANFELQVIQINHAKFPRFPLHGHITIQTYDRLFLPALFPNLDKVLYLDCDMICEDKLDELWNTDLAGYYTAAIEDSLEIDPKDDYLRRHKADNLGLTERDIYVNGGVQLMNLRKMRQDNTVGLFVATAAKLGQRAMFHDQDIVNVALRGHINVLDTKFNWQGVTSRLAQEGLLKQTEKPVIYHFTGKNKPWNSASPHEGAGLYFKYLAKINSQ
jgi:lipopolysaccharide biosynthesis glycosyltransferase